MVDKQKCLRVVMDLVTKSRGRDRVFRLLQYGLRFLLVNFQKIPLLAKVSVSDKESLMDSLKNVASANATARKVLRFFKHKDLFNRLRSNYELLTKTADTKTKQSWYYLAKLLSDSMLFLYFVTDHYLFLGNVEILPKDKLFTFIEWLSDFIWLLNCFVDISTSVDDIRSNMDTKNYKEVERLGVLIVIYILDGFVR